MNRQNQLVRSTVAMLALAATTAFAQAKDLDFPCGDTPETECVRGRVKNTTNGRVTVVKVRQRAKENNCPVIEKTHKGDLNKGDVVDLTLNKACSYHIKFRTPPACSGKKDIDLSSSNVAEGMTRVLLWEVCGDLKVELKHFDRKATD